MKTWKNAEIVALSIEETAGGKWPTTWEGWGLLYGIIPVTTNDSLAAPSTPSEPETPGEQPGEIPSTPGTGSTEDPS